MKSILSGQSIKLKKGEIFRTYCCDCNLCHDYFPSKDVEIFVYRNDFETKKARKK